MKCKVEAGTASETSTGVDRGIDVDFTLYYQTEEMRDQGIDQTMIEGEVTLLPNADGSPGYSAWGSVDNWLDGRTVAHLRKLDSDDHTDVCSAIIEATAAVAHAFAR